MAHKAWNMELQVKIDPFGISFFYSLLPAICALNL